MVTVVSQIANGDGHGALGVDDGDIDQVRDLIRSLNNVFVLDPHNLKNNKAGVECAILPSTISSDGKFQADRFAVLFSVLDMEDLNHTSFELSCCGQYIIMTHPAIHR